MIAQSLQNTQGTIASTGQACRPRARRSTRQLHGRIDLVDLAGGVLERALRVAAADFAAQQAIEFSGDAVRDLELQGCGLSADDALALLPAQALAALELAISPARGVKLYATCGVEPHQDHMDGLSVALVLHSDGFRFRQGSVSLALRAGTWFLFDDGIEHEVVEAGEATSLLVLTAPVRPAHSLECVA